ncbi:MAG TPA: ferrochelatase [Planctomycetaceae bacterium]|nr:ferrochelatase [Planctomycetaceae bacterium]
MMNAPNYDAILFLSFGGPEGPDDVMPFLRNVVRGRNVPDERLQSVAKHYMHFGGVSPINQQNRDVISALQIELATNDIDLPVYFGNRNWQPMLADTMRQMQQDGVQRVLTIVTSAFSSYSGCRQYLENIRDAQQELDFPFPQVDKVRVFFNHPLFIEAVSERIHEAFSGLDAAVNDGELIFTAHSIPMAMADHCLYEVQLNESAKLIAERLNWQRWSLCYQSRSGPPTQPWLEPDICSYLTELADKDPSRAIVIAPLGFLSDHLEVLFDLDIEARQVCDEKGLAMARAATVGTHPKYIELLRILVEERLGRRESAAIGDQPPCRDVCPADCCLPR